MTTLPRYPRIAATVLATMLAGTSITALTAVPSYASVPAGGYADLVDKVSPAVVYVEVTEKPADVASMGDNGQMPQSLPFEEFQRRFGIPFGMMPQMPGGPGDQGAQDAPKRQGVGSGFIISAS